MKIKNNELTAINLILESGAVEVKPGDTFEAPEWVYKMLVTVYPRLQVVEDVIIEAKPEPIVEPEPEVKPEPVTEPKAVKNAKGKKSRK